MQSATLHRPAALAPTPLPQASAVLALQRSLPRWDLVVGFLISVVAASLHFFLYHRQYPLWRDEVNLVRLATFPSFAETYKYLSGDSCPLLFPALVRAWTTFLPPAGDWNLRLLGFGIGLLILGAFWLCARQLGGRAPLLSVALLGFNPLFIRYGDSIRAYGLGIFLALMVFLMVWRVVESARPGRILLAMTVGVLAVNTLFYNAVLVLAICASGAAVVARERRRRHALVLLAVGLPAALSLLVYRPMISEQHRWSFLLYFPVDVPWLWKRVSEVTGSPDPLGIWIWAVLFAGLAGWAALRFFRPGPPLPEREDRAAAFALCTLIVATAGYAAFLVVLKYCTQPWYYVTLLALAAACLDVLFGRLVDTSGRAGYLWRLGRLALVVGFTTLTFLQARVSLATRSTNVDLIAARVAAGADKDDLIVLTRWECAITFNFYYHGNTPQETLPPMADHRLHRYDLLLTQMMTRDAARPVLEHIEKTLRAGHRIWLVGNPVIPQVGEKPPDLEPLVLPAPGLTASNRGDCAVWVMQASFLLEQHATQIELLPVAAPGPPPTYEGLPLSVLQGWRNAD